MNIKPLQDRVVIRQEEEKQQTASGILLPGSAQEKENIGEVIAIGPGKASDSGTIIAMTVAVGNKVMFGQYSGQDIKDGDGNTLKIMREEDLIAIID